MGTTPVTAERAEPDQVILPAWSAPPEVNVHFLMEYRQKQVERREYRPLGILEKVMLESSAVYDTSEANPLTRNRAQSANLDWYKTGPLVGVTRDQDLLICTPTPHPPDLPDPTWRPVYPPSKFVNGIPVPETPPRLPQRLRDRASGILPAPRRSLWERFTSGKADAQESDFWFVFQPVHQVLLLLSDRTGMALIDCSADSCGRHTALLYNPRSQQAHLLFGSRRLEIYRA